MRDLIPWGRNEQSMVPSPLRGEEMSSFLTLHREMNRLFDDMFSHFETGIPSLLGRRGWPSIIVAGGQESMSLAPHAAHMVLSGW